MVDLLGRAPGRGVHVVPDAAALREALSPKALGRAFRGAARPPAAAEVDAIVSDTSRRLEERLLELVGLARRAGATVQGMDSVLAVVAAGAPGDVLVLAEDLSERSLRQVEDALARAREARRVAAPGLEGEGAAPDRGETLVLRVGSKERLGLRLGRDEVGVVAVRSSPMARRLAVEAARWRGLQGSTALQESASSRSRKTPDTRSRRAAQSQGVDGEADDARQVSPGPHEAAGAREAGLPGGSGGSKAPRGPRSDAAPASAGTEGRDRSRSRGPRAGWND